MCVVLAWIIGVFGFLFFLVFMMNVDRAASRFGRWLDSDLPAQRRALDAGVKD